MFFFGKKKSGADSFNEAVRKRDWKKVVKLGKEEFKRKGSKISVNVAISTARAITFVNRKDDAIAFLLEVAREKAKRGMTDDAEYLYLKAYEIKKTPQVVEEILNFYLTRGDKNKALEILNEILAEAEEKKDAVLMGIAEESARKVNEGNIYARIAVLYEKDSPDKAYFYWIRAAEVYEQRGMDEYAFRCLIRAKRVKNTEEINKRIVDFIAVKSGKFPVQILIDILKENNDPEFWLWVFEEFKEKGKKEIFKGIIENEDIDSTIKLFFTVLLLAEVKEVFAEDILEELRERDEEAYTVLVNYLEERYQDTLLKGILGSTELTIEEIFTLNPSSLKKPDTGEKREIGIGEIELDIDGLFQ